MKKMITIFLALVLVLSLAACDIDDVKNPTTNTTTTTDVTEDNTDNTKPTTEPTTKPTEPSTEPTENTEPEHVHNYLVEKITVATCTGTGSTTYICECGASYEDDYVEAYGHDWGQWTAIKLPTETTDGEDERCCENCGERESRTVPKLTNGHTHKYTRNITKKSTCKEEGIATFTCSCGDTYTENIAKTNHSYVTKVTKPTCTENGYTTYTCSACKYNYTDNYVNATNHSYQDIVIAATCTNGGYTNHTCKTCGYKYTDSKTNAKGHNWSNWTTTKEPTETATGIATRKCTACGKTDTKTLDKLTNTHKHSYASEITKAATCTAAGVKTYICSCGDSYTESIAKLNHNYKATVVASTCTEKGYTNNVCTRCNDTYKNNYTNANGHSYTSSVAQAATCTQDGVKIFRCKCGDSYTEAITKLGHKYASTVVKPTCTTNGYTRYECSRCDSFYHSNNVNATGHSYTSKVTKTATCTVDGIKTNTCSKCSDSYTEVIKAVGHNYTSKVTAPTCTAKGYTTYTCSKCSDSYKSNYKDALNHKNTKVETQAAGCTTDGYTKVFCSDCGTLISSKVIPANGSHAYETMRLNVAAKKNDAMYAEERKGTMYENWYTAKYGTWTDWDVQICRDCCEIDTSTIVFAYTPLEAAEIMLGYVNELREEVYGTDYYNLKLDPTLQELAEIRAKEIATTPNGMYVNGTYTGAKEIMRDGGVSLREQFDDWKTLYANAFTNKNYMYFGYGKYEIQDTGDHPAYFYGILLFWTDGQRNNYIW